MPFIIHLPTRFYSLHFIQAPPTAGYCVSCSYMVLTNVDTEGVDEQRIWTHTVIAVDRCSFIHLSSYRQLRDHSAANKMHTENRRNVIPDLRDIRMLISIILTVLY